ncbi:hypothetical protein H1P_6480007 [Hyella patelloides LEGE 07179]|uniref:Uncharacterized protein n=1 Tax=Hyella patelloides LEGE 07179 TaxID=945734 RepID=A0A563W2B9_9CYAN|nr:hypothetical protein [Hyella patelloides]VEP17828.1 hypothetical protein H1P_6480007 [Hyella patelloides LEGE 07179]
MPNQNNNLLMGMFLQDADLISSYQWQNALDIQAKYTKVKLEQILVSQKIIKPQTLDFFGNQWQKIKEEGRQFPIGYYLQDSGLLNEQQVHNILREQEKNNLKFGDIAVNQGWIKQGTINFFLDNLLIKSPQIISLDLLKEYNQNQLHLEHKYPNSSLILSSVLAWTGGNSILTKDICQIFTDSNFNIPIKEEANTVDQFIEKFLIENWQTSDIGKYIRLLKKNLDDNQRCNSIKLLQEYREILLSDNQKFPKTQEQEELLILGLIVKEKERLKVANLIYLRIFNLDCINQQIAKLQQVINLQEIEQVDTYQNNPKTKSKNHIKLKNSQLMKQVKSLTTLIGVISFIYLFLVTINHLLLKNKIKQLNVLQKIRSL